MSIEADCVVLKMPFKAEYVSIARLAVSGVASRMGFDIDTVEDIKVATAEVCNKLVEVGSNSAKDYSITFQVYNNKLNIIFDCEDSSLKCLFSYEEDELGISIITALMDEVELCSCDSHLLSISKLIGENI